MIDPNLVIDNTATKYYFYYYNIMYYYILILLTPLLITTLLFVSLEVPSWPGACYCDEIF